MPRKLALTTMGKGFAIALQIAAPFIVFGIIINLGLGVLSRLMPSLQVFFIGVPITIVLGFFFLPRRDRHDDAAFPGGDRRASSPLRGEVGRHGGEGEQEDRTEDPTERKLQQAIERGDVAKRSMEVNTWFVLAGGALAILAAAANPPPARSAPR